MSWLNNCGAWHNDNPLRILMILYFSALLSCIYNNISNKVVNPLSPSNAICLPRSGSTLSQAMAYCLIVPSHNLYQCWLIISKVLNHSYDTMKSEDKKILIRKTKLEIDFILKSRSFQKCTHFVCKLLVTYVSHHHAQKEKNETEPPNVRSWHDVSLCIFFTPASLLWLVFLCLWNTTTNAICNELSMDPKLISTSERNAAQACIYMHEYPCRRGKCFEISWSSGIFGINVIWRIVLFPKWIWRIHFTNAASKVWHEI